MKRIKSTFTPNSVIHASEGCVSDKGIKYSVSITQSFVNVSDKARKNCKAIAVSEIVGCHVKGDKFNIIAYRSTPEGCCSPASLVRLLYTYRVESPSDCNEVARIIRNLACNVSITKNGDFTTASDHSASPSVSTVDAASRLFWVFINPVSGTKQALSIWDGCKGLFDDAGITYNVHITTRANDCLDLVKNCLSRDILKYDAIVTVSGDGLLLEALTGVMQRRDWKEVVNKVALYPLPGGTGNGLSKSIVNYGGMPYTPLHAALVCAKNYTRRMDVATYETEDMGRGYSFLELMWGLPADIDIESEVCRFMGSLRLELYGVQRICCLRKYKGCFSYLPSDSRSGPYYWDGKGTTGDEVAPFFQLLPDFDQPVPSTWKVMDGDWVMMWAMNVTHASGKDFVAPTAEIDDGYYTCIILRDVGRCSLLDMMLKLESGTHVNNPSVEVIKTRAFRLEPQRLRHARGGILDVDGEEIQYGKVQFEVLRGFIKTFCPPSV
jgi:sphingosine kinase